MDRAAFLTPGTESHKQQLVPRANDYLGKEREKVFIMQVGNVNVPVRI